MSSAKEKLKKLKELYDEGVLSKEEYDQKRLQIIDGQILGASPPSNSSPPPVRATQTPTQTRATAVGGASARETVSSSPPPSRATQATQPRATAVDAGNSRETVSSYSPPLSSPGLSNSRETSPRGNQANEKVAPESPRSPRPKFDSSMPYDPANTKKAYKEDHQRKPMPVPPKSEQAQGQVGQRMEMPAALREFTSIKVVQQPENPKVGVYLGPAGGTGGVYSSQYDVRRKLAIGAPEVSTKGHIGAAAEKISTIKIHTAGNACFEERVFVNTNVLDLISAVVKKLELVHPPSYFGMIQKRSGGEVWISSDVLASELGTQQLVLVPKQEAPEDVKKNYFSKVLAKPQRYEVATDGPTFDVANAPNEGKALHPAYDLKY